MAPSTGEAATDDAHTARTGPSWLSFWAAVLTAVCAAAALAAGVVTIISSLAVIAVLIGLSSLARENLADRFEVTAITINWLVLLVAGVLLGIAFRRAGGEQW